MKEEVYIALGSNLDEPKQHILQAFRDLNNLQATEILATSSLYQTKPWGVIEQNDFINAVVKCHTSLNAYELLAALLEIEQRHARLRTQKNGPRTLDCDILLYGQKVYHGAKLTVPHPRMLTRNFVLIPLLEIAPDLSLPGGKALSHYLSDQPGAVTKIEEVSL